MILHDSVNSLYFMWGRKYRIINFKNLLMELGLIDHCNGVLWGFKHLRSWKLNDLSNSLLRLTTKKTSNFYITPPMWGESTGDQGINSHNAEYTPMHFQLITMTS